MRAFAVIAVIGLLICGAEGAARGIAYIGESNTFQTNQIGGVVTFDQATVSDDVMVTGTVTGLAPNSIHGFHVHVTGDSRDLASTFQSHFNPDGQTHGAPPMAVRHNGDMGNITADASGIATISITIGQSKMSLFPGAANSIIGRGVIVHPLFDQGAGTAAGNAGTPQAFGKIGVANLVDNEAGPSSGLAYAISNHVGLGAQLAGGSLWIQVTGGNITVYTNFSGFIPEGHYQLRFYEFGDQLLTSRNSGPAILEAGTIKVTNKGLTCHNMTVASVGDLIGRMSVLFNTDGVAFANIVSMGVVSVGNSAVPFLNPTANYECTGPAGAWTSGAGTAAQVLGVWVTMAVAAAIALLQL